MIFSVAIKNLSTLAIGQNSKLIAYINYKYFMWNESTKHKIRKIKIYIIRDKVSTNFYILSMAQNSHLKFINNLHP